MKRFIVMAFFATVALIALVSFTSQAQCNTGTDVDWQTSMHNDADIPVSVSMRLEYSYPTLDSALQDLFLSYQESAHLPYPVLETVDSVWYMTEDGDEVLGSYQKTKEYFDEVVAHMMKRRVILYTEDKYHVFYWGE